ncbi:hypothetical protein JCGZ_22609 [Jatropha curcas]|uniref:GRAS34 protein n=1 Tax=Jatropha curcas TaxID=180498 RepID=A0A067JZV5_JATCU|nr:GRAS family protein RAD1 [Jatropha curcas]AMR43755.1 GRAS34 protein [Jatropha curcas]KDP25074.1 hypothetical protein JCGZ_22609 [Jatropha curcas]
MEAMNGRLSFSMHESLNHDFAIRRFCPARMEQEQGVELEETIIMNDFELLSSCDDTISNPHLAASEVDELVDSFINVDQLQDIDNDNHQSPKKFQDEIMDAFPMVEGGDELEMRSGSYIYEEMVGVPSVEEESHGVDQGLHLVHLLLACAEAVGCRDTQLANSILSQIWTSVNSWGDSLQRVSYCFALGLKSRLSLLVHNVDAMDVTMVTRKEKMEAFQLLYQTTPYIAFGFMAANEAICQAAKEKDSLHVIDLGMDSTLQWPSFIRTLASRPEGPPTVRITGLINNDQNLLELEASMKALVEDASSFGISLEFDILSEPVSPAVLTRENLNLREGETLFVNSVMHLHKFVKESRGSLKAILQAIKKLSPTLLTVVEQDANHNGPFFLGRFLESLHYYSAIFDSLEASLPRTNQQRMKIEKHHFAEEVRNIVAYEGADRVERHERADQWRRQLGRAGFQAVELKCLSQARMMLSVYGVDGYTLGSEKGCLLLGWKGRPIVLASAWQLHNVPPPS